MSHRFKENWEKAQQQSKELLSFQGTFKQWLVKVSIVNIILVIFCIVLYSLGDRLLYQVGLALVVFFNVTTLHEFMHGELARFFGYKRTYLVAYHYTLPIIGKDISSLTTEVTWPDGYSKNKKWIICLFPNVVLISVSIIFIFLGSLFFLVLGAITLGWSLFSLLGDVIEGRKIV